MQCSKAKFSSCSHDENICAERAEVSHSICANLGGVFDNFTATLLPTFESFWGCGAVFQKSPTFFTLYLLTAKSKFNVNKKDSILRSSPLYFYFSLFFLFAFDKLNSLVERWVIICELNNKWMRIHIRKGILMELAECGDKLIAVSKLISQGIRSALEIT